MPDLSSYSYTLIRKEHFLELDYNSTKLVFNLDSKLVYEQIDNSLFILRTDLGIDYILDYTNSTNPATDNIDDYLHILRKLFTPTVSKDFYTELALGNIEESEILVKFGENLSLGTTRETIWANGGLWEPLIGTTGEIINISSSSNDDIFNTGDGGHTVTIYGLTTDYVGITETIPLTGITETSTSNRYTLINRAIVTTAGSNQINTGNITLTANDSATVQAYIPENTGITQQVFYKAPADHIVQVKGGYLAVLNNNAVNAKVTFEMWYRYPTGIKLRTMSTFIDSSIKPTEKITNDVSHFLPEGTTLELIAFSDTANTKVSASLYLIIEDIYS